MLKRFQSGFLVGNCGIYSITNILNGQRYIGSSVDIRNRWRSHRNMLRTNRHHSAYLQNSYNANGETNFVFAIIEECPENSSKQFLIEREQHYLDELVPEYNGSKIAGRVDMTLEVREKISKKALGRSSAFKGRKHTEESKKLIFDNHADCKGEKGAFYGKKHTKEAKILIGNSKRGDKNYFYGKQRSDHSELMTGENNPFYGKQHSKETIFIQSSKKCKLNIDQMIEVINIKNANPNITQQQLADNYKRSITSINRILTGKIKALKYLES